MHDSQLRIHTCKLQDRVAPIAARTHGDSAPLGSTMIQSNLNPAQARIARPTSASLRTPRGARTEDPSFARLKSEAQATPRLPPPEVDPEAGDEEPWLFRFARSCTTAEVWRMGFSRVVVFSTANWADAAAPVRELNEAFRPRQPIADLSRASTEALQAAIAPTFQRGDVLFVSRATALPPAAALRGRV